MSADPERNELVADGKRLPLELPSLPPLRELAFEFNDDLNNWRPTRGILTAESRDGSLVLRLIAPGALLHSPPLAAIADQIKTIEIRMRIRAQSAKPAGLYFTTEQYPNIWSDKLVNFPVQPDGEFHTYRLHVAGHPKWRGQTITGLRLDPLRGATEAEVHIDYIRGVATTSE